MDLQEAIFKDVPKSPMFIKKQLHLLIESKQV
jgi:hypothetical protein